MPELPEVETVVKGLRPHMEGKTIVKVVLRRPDLRFPFPKQFAKRLEGKAITYVGRRAKYGLVHLTDGTVLILHLGMSGSFRVQEPVADGTVADKAFHYQRSKSEAHDHVILSLSDNTAIIYNDPRRFGFMDLTTQTDFETSKHFKGMGVEPLGNRLSASYLAEYFYKKKSPLKAALLDQRIIAGLGNIYVCEALWRAGLSPRRAAATLVRKTGAPGKRVERLVDAVVSVIEDAIEAGGSTLRDYVHTDGSLGYFQHTFAVYGREGEPCRREGCRGIITRIVQSGRSTYYCPQCQH